MVVLAELTIKH